MQQDVWWGPRAGLTHVERGNPITLAREFHLRPETLTRVLFMMEFCSSQQRSLAHQLIGTAFRYPNYESLRQDCCSNRNSAEGFQSQEDIDLHVSVMRSIAERADLELYFQQTPWRGTHQKVVIWLTDSILDAHDRKRAGSQHGACLWVRGPGPT